MIDFGYAHWSARLCAGLILLLLAIRLQSILASSVMIVLCVLLLWRLDRSWRTVVASARLLRWLVVPILLMHALFTHGELLWSGLPLTREGVLTGLRLSLHLSAIFVAALVLFRVLHRYQWVRLLAAMPGAARLLPHFHLLMSMREQMMQRLAHLRDQWRLRRRWRELHLLLLAAFVTALRASRLQADMLWLRWPQGSLEGAVERWRWSSTLILLCLTLVLAGGFAWMG